MQEKGPSDVNGVNEFELDKSPQGNMYLNNNRDSTFKSLTADQNNELDHISEKYTRPDSGHNVSSKGNESRNHLFSKPLVSSSAQSSQGIEEENKYEIRTDVKKGKGDDSLEVGETGSLQGSPRLKGKASGKNVDNVHHEFSEDKSDLAAAAAAGTLSGATKISTDARRRSTADPRKSFATLGEQRHQEERNQSGLTKEQE